MTNFPIALSLSGGRGVMMPRVRDTNRFVKDVFRELVPEVIPDRQARPEPTAEAPPPWLEEFKPPKIDQLDARLAELDQQLLQVKNEVDEVVREREYIDAFRGLIWMKGKWDLEPVVIRALNLLGLNCEKREPYDVYYDGPGGPLIIEIEGSNNEISVDKGRQLLDYKSRADDPALLKGAIIGNPFRLAHPKQRPLANRPLFSPQLTSLAEQQKWPLVTTLELWHLVERHLNADDNASDDLRKLLGLPLKKTSA
jgi:hypothetical protein